MTEPTGALAAAMKRDAGAPPDKLDKIRAEVRAARDLQFDIQRVEEDLREKKLKLNDINFRVLPELFMVSNVEGIDLGAEGNYPAFDAQLQPYYHANISQDWPPERQEAGYAWLEKRKHGDVIKNIITIELGRGTEKVQKTVRAALKKLKVPFSERRGVSWNTLTALVRELVEDKKQVLGDTDREAIGATVGVVVKLKQRKKEK